MRSLLPQRKEREPGKSLVPRVGAPPTEAASNHCRCPSRHVDRITFQS